MKVLGKTVVGGTWFELPSNTKRVARYNVVFAARIAKLSVYLDGLGSGNGSQVMRGVIYDTSGNLIAQGDEVTVLDGQAAGWVDLPFTAFPGGVEVVAGLYDFGVLGGVQTNSIRLYGDDPGSGALTSALPLTLSGNEITDPMRALGQVGDGQGYVQVTNLVQNGGVESNLTNWSGGWGPGSSGTITRITSDSKFGAACVEFTTTAFQTGGSWSFVFANLASTLQAGHTYTLSFWAKVVSGNQNYSVEVGDSTSLNLALRLTALQTLPVGVWTKVTVTFTAAVNGNIPGFFIQPTTAGAAGVGTIRLDGVQLEVGAQSHDYVETNNNAPQTQTQIDQVSNYVPNPSFEVDVGPLWGNWTNATLTLSLLQAKDGAQSLLVQNTGAGGNTYGPAGQVYLPANTTFTASVWVYATVARNFNLVVRSKDKNLATIGADQTSGNVAVPANQWTRLTFTFATPALTYQVQLAPQSLASAAGETFFVDAVQIEIGSTATTYMIAPVYLPLAQSTGMWEATTNLLSNSDFETNASGWTYAGSPSGYGDVARDTSVSRFRVASLRAFGVQAQNFIATGNEITDTLRAANVQGDGRSYQYVFNACPNGGFETNTTGWSLFQGATITQDATHVKFGTKALKVVTPGVTVAGGGEGVTGPNSGVGTATQGQTWTFSMWVFSVAGGEQVALVMEERTSTGTFITSSSVNVTLVAGWNRLVGSRTLTSSTVSQVGVDLRTATVAQAITVWIDGVQFEVGAVAHDYVETSTVGVGAIQGPLVTNYIANGGFEYAVIGWSNFGTGAITRTTAQQNFGVAAGSVVVAAANDGASASVTVPLNQAYVGSIYLKGTNGRSYKLSLTGLGTGTVRGTVTVVATGAWQRITVTGTPTGADTGLNLFVQAVAAGADTFFIDGAQLESGYRVGTTASTYVDTNGVAVSAAVGVPDASQGFWESTTNLCPNGGVETGLSNISGSGINQPTGFSAALGVGVGLTGTFIYRLSTYVTNVNGTFESGASAATGSVTAANQDIVVNLGTIGNADATGRKIYRSSDGGTTWKLVATVAGTGAGATFDDTTPDAGLGANVSLPTSNGTGVFTRVLTGARFGAAALQVHTPGGVQREGVFFSSNTGLARAAATPVIGSGWMIGTPGVKIDVWLRVNNADATSSDSAAITYTMTGDWMRVVTPAHSVQAGKVGDSYSVMFRTSLTATLTTFFLDGVQIEEKGLVTPYVHTNGATVFHDGSHFSHGTATNFVTASQGWVGAWMRMGATSSTLPAGMFYNVFSWAVDGTNTNRLVGYYAQSTGKFHMESDAGGGSASLGVTLAFNAGDLVYVEFAWTATTVAVSVNGAAFVSVARPAVQTGATLSLNIGGAAGTSSGLIDSDMLWLGTGKGTRSNADTLATYNSLIAGTEPANTTFAAANTLTALAPMATTAYVDWANSWPFIRTSAGNAVTAGTVYTFSTWVLAPAGQTISVALRRADFTTSWGQTNITGTGTWQRVQVTGTAPASETAYMFVLSSTALIGGAFWIDGAQLETKAVATPFTPGTRNAARAQIPSSLIGATQGWVALRVRLGFGNADLVAGGNPEFFSASDGTTNNRIQLRYNPASGKWLLDIASGGVATQAGTPAQVFTAGTTVTVIARWTTGGACDISLNGGAFTHAGSGTGTFAAPLGLNQVDIGGSDGSGLTGRQIDSDVFWVATGIGAPTDADAATLNGFGNTTPSFSALPASPTMVWNATTTTYVSTLSGQFNTDTYADGASNPFGVSTPLDYDLSVFATYTSLVQELTTNEDDFYYARLPFDRAQEALDTGKAEPGAVLANCGWHGSRTDRERGSFVIVNSDGPLADLVGERLRLTTGRETTMLRSVIAYCHTQANLDGDLSVTRRLALALGAPGDDLTPVEVEVLS